MNPSEPRPAHDPKSPSQLTLEQQRLANRQATEELGLLPYGQVSPGLLSLAQAIARYNPEADEHHRAQAKDPGFIDRRPVVRVAGRVVLMRDNGKLIWMTLRDDTGDLQIALSQRDVVAPGFDLAKLTDLGDLVIASGPLAKTKTGEITVWATTLAPAAKSLVPPPAKHEGLQDVELRYRRRYVDLWANPGTMRVFQLRSALITAMRRFLDGRGFIEVDTPSLQSLAGGAAARPFSTHMNALDIDLFMRVSPELYLKRLLVGGMSRVYEIARNFRNEGLDKSHNPEFSMVEIYEAFGDYHTMMELTESLLRELASIAAASPVGPGPGQSLPFGDYAIDYTRPFERVTYEALFEQAFGFSMWDAEKVRGAASKKGLKIQGVDPLLLVGELFDQAEERIDPARPTFVMDYPADLCPLTRSKIGRPEIAERFELFIGGMEIANAYTELNDPDIQEAKFRDQLQGLDDEESTFRTFDEDFVRALKVGMPPAGGLGIGIDRLVMLLANQRTIRDVLLFPMMRPEV
jgi:lysyl-tRNA synthetase, class II